MLDKVTTPKSIRRDPFGRRSLMREPCRNRKCNWCGSESKFKYEWDNDDSGRARSVFSMRNALPFCGIKCFDAYYGK